METTNWVPLFPEQASTFAWQVDSLYFYLVAVSIAFTVPIVLAIFIFAMKYRAKEKYGSGAEIHGSMVLETTWSIIPFIVSMTIFLGGAIVFFDSDKPYSFMTDLEKRTVEVQILSVWKSIFL